MESKFWYLGNDFYRDKGRGFDVKKNVKIYLVEVVFSKCFNMNWKMYGKKMELKESS